MNRRQFLTAASSSIAAALAGCTAPSSGREGDGNDSGDGPENDSPQPPDGDPMIEQLPQVDEPSDSPDEVFDPGGDEEFKDWEAKPPTVRYYEDERILAVEGRMRGGGCSTGLKKDLEAGDTKAFIALNVLSSKPEDPDEPVACPAVIRTYPYSFAVRLPEHIDDVEITTSETIVLSLPGLESTVPDR